MSHAMINMSRGVPPGEVFPLEELQECAAAVLAQDGKQVLTYNFIPGYAPLRQLIADRNRVAVEEVYPANGTVEIIHYLTQLLIKPGDRVFVEAPSYDRAVKLFRIAGAEVVGIPMQEDGLDIDRFEAEARRKAPKLVYTITDFHNPLGTVTSVEKRQRLAGLARELGFYVIDDSPYRLLRYEGEDLPALRSFAPDRVLQLSSVSKLLAPGLRVSWALAPADLVRQMIAWGMDVSMASSSLPQAIVYEYLRRGWFERNIERLKAVYAPRLRATVSAVQRHLPGVCAPQARGGFFVGVFLPEGNRMEKLMQRAAGVGLKITDGRAFFTNPADGERFLRIPFCSLTPEEIEEAAARLATIVEG